VGSSFPPLQQLRLVIATSMCYATRSSMKASLLAFALMALVTVGFALATLFREMELQWLEVRQTGDSSLGRNSVNWIAGLALGIDLVICLLLK
jgi:hypothetical protein